MSKWRIARRPALAARLTTIAIGAAVASLAALAMSRVQSTDADCSLFQVRLETSDYPALALRLCAMIPSAGGAAIVRYDVAVHIAIMPARPR